MRLVSVRLRGVGVFEDIMIRLADGGDRADDDAHEIVAPRPVTVLFGADGIGKTTLLTALSVTRPGHALPPSPYPRAPAPASAEPVAPPSAVTEWLLGDDDPERPHPLVVASPSAVLDGETTESAGARRRDEARSDRSAQT
jgi:hypothetical protein